MVDRKLQLEIPALNSVSTYEKWAEKEINKIRAVNVLILHNRLNGRVTGHLAWYKEGPELESRFQEHTSCLKFLHKNTVIMLVSRPRPS